jgi:hypothetical protein
MAFSIAAIILILILIVFFEYRLRKPDQIVLFENKDIINARKARFYPRHFSLAISGSVQSQIIEIEAEAKGHLLVNIRIALSAAAELEHLDKLIRTGGWKESCINVAMGEGKVLLESYVKEFCANYEIEELSHERLTDYLKKKFVNDSSEFGLKIVSLSVQSIEPKEKEIIIAMQQREEARLKEQTEQTKQKVLSNIPKSKENADQKILQSENEL